MGSSANSPFNFLHILSGRESATALPSGGGYVNDIFLSCNPKYNQNKSIPLYFYVKKSKIPISRSEFERKSRPNSLELSREKCGTESRASPGEPRNDESITKEIGCCVIR